jgi:hypothetical protein
MVFGIESKKHSFTDSKVIKKMPQTTSGDLGGLLGTFATILAAIFSFLTENWVQILTLAFSAVALTYTIKNSRAAFALKRLEIEHAKIKINIDKMAWKKASSQTEEPEQ